MTAQEKYQLKVHRVGLTMEELTLIEKLLMKHYVESNARGRLEASELTVKIRTAKIKLEVKQ